MSLLLKQAKLIRKKKTKKNKINNKENII